METAAGWKVDGTWELSEESLKAGSHRQGPGGSTDSVSPLAFFFFEVVLAILVFCIFFINFRISLSIKQKKPAGISIVIVLTLQASLGRIAILAYMSSNP